MTGGIPGGYWRLLGVDPAFGVRVEEDPTHRGAGTVTVGWDGRHWAPEVVSLSSLSLSLASEVGRFQRPVDGSSLKGPRRSFSPLTSIGLGPKCV